MTSVARGADGGGQKKEYKSAHRSSVADVSSVADGVSLSPLVYSPMPRDILKIRALADDLFRKQAELYVSRKT